jgi:hypothetical protein
VSELDASLLARHVRLLLRCYPKAYRAHRGEEILDTLLETTRPGRGWPPAREVASVIGGGLRARRAANLSQGFGISLRQAMILGVAAALISEVSTVLVGPLVVQIAFRGSFSAPYGLASTLLGIGVAATIAGAWSGRRWIVPIPLAATFGVAVAYYAATFSDTSTDSAETASVLPLIGMVGLVALVVLTPLTTRAARPPLSLLWFACSPLLVYVVEVVLIRVQPGFHDVMPLIRFAGQGVVSPYESYLSLATLALAICWLVTDVRPLLGAAVGFAVPNAISTVVNIGGYVSGDGLFGPNMGRLVFLPTLVATMVPLALTGALVWLLRHRTRTAPPTIG